MHISWQQRKRNLERFFHKRTRYFSSRHSFSFTHSFSSQDVVSPRTSDQELHEASHEDADSHGSSGEVSLQQTQLRSGNEDEAERLLLPANGAVHGRCPDTTPPTRGGGRVDHRAAGEELQSLPEE